MCAEASLPAIALESFAWTRPFGEQVQGSLVGLLGFVARSIFDAVPGLIDADSDIVRANTFTWFNGLIGTLWLIMLLVAPVQDSLFGFVIVANTAIGVIQEYRASRTLAKLAVLGEARPIVRRDGTDVDVSPHDVVLDDIIVLRTGDQLVVDGKYGPLTQGALNAMTGAAPGVNTGTFTATPSRRTVAAGATTTVALRGVLALAEDAPPGHGLADAAVAAYDEAVSRLL